jgi:hypothetical protein
MPKPVSISQQSAASPPVGHSPRAAALTALAAAGRWTHVATLTFRLDANEHLAACRFEAFVRRLEQRGQGRVDYLAVAARHAPWSKAHVHALLAAPPSLTVEAIREAWLSGRQQVKLFDPLRGARQYVASHARLVDSEILFRRSPPGCAGDSHRQAHIPFAS